MSPARSEEGAEKDGKGLGLDVLTWGFVSDYRADRTVSVPS